MAGLSILKHTHNPSDEELCALDRKPIRGYFVRWHIPDPLPSGTI
jgi:hypothetical protein